MASNNVKYGPQGIEAALMSAIAMEPMLGEITRNGKVVNTRGRYRGAGRPKGAIDYKTRELSAYILSKHRHPIEAAAEIVDAPITDLAEKLACTRLEAAEYWRKCVELVAKYTLSAMPAQVNVTAPLAGYLTVVNLASPRPGDELNISAYGLDMHVKGGSPPAVIEHQD